MPLQPATTELELQRRYWLLAATLFGAGGLGAIPAIALQEPAREPAVYLLPLLAFVSAAVCWSLAGRAGRRWLPLMTAIATAEIALTVGFAGDVFAIYYLLIAFYAAYVFRSRRMVAAQFGIAVLAALLPIAYDPEHARETAIQGVVLIPTLMVTAAAITFLRERLEASEDRFRRLAASDPLTGVGNYRLLVERMSAELSHHRRHGRSLALIVVDLDDFKIVNDEHGHQHGDRVLQEAAGSLLASVRASDTLVRHGGDEFCVIAPETDRARAEELATRLVEGITGVAVDDRSLGACTGSAICPDDAETLKGLLEAADERLRANKRLKPGLSRTGGLEARGVPDGEAPGRALR